MPINKPRKMLFIHIPKTSGTYITEKFRLMHGDLRSGEDCLLGRTKQHYPLSLIKQILDNRNIDFYNYHIFTVLRNPYDRFASAFYQHRGNKEFKRMLGKRSIEDFAQHLIEKVNDDGYDIFWDGPYHQFQPMNMFIDEKDINIKYYNFGSEKYYNFIETYCKKFDLPYNKDEIIVNSYEISEELKNKINFLYKEDLKLYNNVQNCDTSNSLKKECSS